MSEWDRIAIIGTAETWRETPWHDKTLKLMGLNDAWCLDWPRFPDVWFEQHPLGQPNTLTPEDLPPGRHLRPEGHIAWLQKASERIPVFLQNPPPRGWPPKAQRYPIEHMSEKFRDILRVDPTWQKDYAMSGITWMLLWALDMGVKELHIYGIHLATEREYMDQRPNFELIIGWAIAKGVKIVLPPTAPILKGREVYCYEPRMSQAMDQERFRLGRINDERTRLVKKLASRGWWQPTYADRESLFQLEVDKMDCDQKLLRLWVADQSRSPEWRAWGSG
jgi:hypothetical protein